MTEEELEKEAEEYTKKKICKNCTYRCYIENILKSNKLDCFAYAREYKTFKDGCKCGYDKAKEENAEAKDIIEDLITKIPASFVEHFESEKERAEKFLGWK